MGLLVDLQFGAILSKAEQRLLAELPDWPAQTKLSDAERALAPRLARLGCINVERCKDDPIQVWFDLYAGATFVGRRGATTGLVRISPAPNQTAEEKPS